MIGWNRGALIAPHQRTEKKQKEQVVSRASDLIKEYLSVGGLFNPEIMNQTQHDAVRDTLIRARDEICILEDRIKRLEDACDEAIAFCELLNPVAQTPNIPELVAKNLRKAKERN